MNAMRLLRHLLTSLIILLIALALWRLEAARESVEVSALEIGTTPTSLYQLPGAQGPVVVIAHGFAGSRQLMEPFAFTLAHAGYRAVTFDFEGHGLNPTPMSGDVTAVEGTTMLLMAETGRVIDAALAATGEGRVALIGHSMASDIVVRQTIADPRVATVIGVSTFSEAITAEAPKSLLLITGEWESWLREEALKALRLVEPGALEGDRVEAGGVVRQAVVAPSVEHLSVLYSATTLEAARTWLDETFGRMSEGPVAAYGGWILLLLCALVVLAWPASRLLPAGEGAPLRPPVKAFFISVLGPAAITPLILWALDLRLLPVLVADYLFLHLLVQGVLSLLVLRACGALEPGALKLAPLILMLALGLVVFGLALDRYAVNFWPHAGRLPILAALAVGAIPFMVADALLSEAGRAPLWRRMLLRAAFFTSLGGAIALDFEHLFFLIIILPVIFAFFLIFGLMGRWAGRRTGAPLSTGIALGIILAWALGVSFPLFSA